MNTNLPLRKTQSLSHSRRCCRHDMRRPLRPPSVLFVWWGFHYHLSKKYLTEGTHKNISRWGWLFTGLCLYSRQSSGLGTYFGAEGEMYDSRINPILNLPFKEWILWGGGGGRELHARFVVSKPVLEPEAQSWRKSAFQLRSWSGATKSMGILPEAVCKVKL